MNKTTRTSDGLQVDVLPMEMYPDGCLLVAELSSVFLPAVSGLPAGTLGALKEALADGNMRDAVALFAKLDGSVGGSEGSLGKSIFDGFARVLMTIADRERFTRITGQLLATLTVTVDGKRIELLDKERIRRATEGSMKRFGELVAIAARENLTSFFSGAGGTSVASVSG